jgi:hypothetical protein
MIDRLKPFIPRRVRRLYRKYVSPVIRDDYYYEYSARDAFFRRAFMALTFNGIDGDYLEFGCCGGVTFVLAHKYLRKYHHNGHMWAFDSFCGLPPKHLEEDNHPQWVEGAFSIEVDEFKKICEENRIQESEYSLIVGYYEHTLVDAPVKDLPMNICMVYIDCDMYSSAKVVLDFLIQRLKHGMIIAFDDYYCWSSTQPSGERKACAEHFRNNEEWALVPYIQFGMGGMSFVVESKKLNGATGATF